MQKGCRKEYKKVFISWSGDNSKVIAIELKNTLQDMFTTAELECFVSDVDIGSGDDWWNKIKSELKKCKLGIACVTKENLKAPWIYFESGAIVARDIKLIPLLVNCSISSLNETPLHSKHMVDFYNRESFIQMIKTINKDLKLLTLDDSNLRLIAINGYNRLINNLSETMKKLKAMRVFNEKYIYPRSVTTVNVNTLYISAPMSSISESDYYKLREFLESLKPMLESIGFTRIVCPHFNNPDYNNFDGSTKAIKENFIELKQVDSMIVIYPESAASSVLVEIGYGIALCKKMVIFYKEDVPFILKDAGNNVSHIDSRKYSNYNDITHIIESNGEQLFKYDEED